MNADEISEEFDRALPAKGGCLVVTCSCNRTHFATGDDHAGYEPGELDDLRAKAKTDADRYREDSENYSIGSCLIRGVTYVIGCPCEYLVRLERLLVAGEAWILDFYLMRRESERKRRAPIDHALDTLTGGKSP